FVLSATDEVLRQIANYSSGDARSAYNVLEVAAALVAERTRVSIEQGQIPHPPQSTGKGGSPSENIQAKAEITTDLVQDALQKRVLLYDKSGEEHYNLISALHKSVRNSDPDASLYWLGRMLEAGEDPLYIARRIVRFASEDVGLADPMALPLAVSAMQAFHFVGQPEGMLALAEAAVYMATAPKSNALYKSYGSVLEDVRNTVAEPVPLHLRNAPTRLMKNLNYGKGYQYAHDSENRLTDMTCLPDSLKNRVYYVPSGNGCEKTISDRLKEWREKIKQLREKKDRKSVV